MKIKNILVGVDGSAVSLARLETGINLAQVMDASVSALYVIPFGVPAITAGTMHGGWYMGQEMLAKSHREALSAAGDVRAACERLAENYQTSLEWIQKEGEIVSTVCNEARYHDVFLLGKPDTVNEPQVRNNDVNGILLSSGKPCLVIPGATPILKQIPEKVMFGWDGSREAAQAMHHAMPFLEQADSVMVVSIYKLKERKETVEKNNKRMVDYLIQHEINASSHNMQKSSTSKGELLVQYGEESEADLIVMGAYGHSRFREVLLGGATNHMLHHTLIPTLFAH